MPAGYMNLNGDWVIQPEYDFTSSFCNGVAGVIRDGVAGAIDHSNHFLSFDFPAREICFSGRGVAGVKNVETDRYGLIDRFGKWILPPEYDLVSCYEFGLVQVSNLDGTYSHFNDRGEPLVGFEDVDFTYGFYFGYALVHRKGSAEQEFINIRGETVCKVPVGKMSFGVAPFQIDSSLAFKAGTSANGEDLDQFSFIQNLHGDVLVRSDDHRRIGPTRDGLVEAEDLKTGLLGLIDICGNWILKPKYDGVASWTHGLFLVSNRGRMSLVDVKGNELLEKTYPRLHFLSYWKPTGHLVAWDDKGRNGVIDMQENAVIPFKIQTLGLMSEGLIRCSIN